jgi:hypothetical protein
VNSSTFKPYFWFVFIGVASAYLYLTFNLSDVKIIAGNVTPRVNLLFLLVLTILGIGVGFVTAKKDATFQLKTDFEGKKHRRHYYILAGVLIFYKIALLIFFSDTIQYLHVWPDGAGYVRNVKEMIKDPVHFFPNGAMKGRMYSIWILINHFILGSFFDPVEGDVFGQMISKSYYFPTLVAQTLLGIFSGLICFSIFSRLSVFLGYSVTLLTFLNPTTIAMEWGIIRASSALFLVLAGFFLFIKAYQNESRRWFFWSGILFFLATIQRQELIALYLTGILFYLAYTIFYRKQQWKSLLIFASPMLILIFISISLFHSGFIGRSYKGNYSQALHGVKSECYFYENPRFPKIMKNTQEFAKKCEEERGAPCDSPATTYWLIWLNMQESVRKYARENTPEGGSPFSYAHVVNDQIFMDILKKNTALYAKSLAANMGYNLIHNVENVTPIFYDGDDPNISMNWNYFASPKVLDFCKDEDSPKFLVAFFSAIEPYTTRKILFPFFFIGSLVVFYRGRKLAIEPKNNEFLLRAILVFTWVHFLFVSVISFPVARFIYVLMPFIFCIKLIGCLGVYHFLNRVFFQQAFASGMMLRWRVFRSR